MLVLVLNCGSSSVKLSLEDTGAGRWLARGSVERVGDLEEPGTRRMRLAVGQETAEEAATPGYREAIQWLVERLPDALKPAAVGHRVVHGGERYTGPVRIDAAVLEELEQV